MIHFTKLSQLLIFLSLSLLVSCGVESSSDDDDNTSNLPTPARLQIPAASCSAEGNLSIFNSSNSPAVFYTNELATDNILGHVPSQNYNCRVDISKLNSDPVVVKAVTYAEASRYVNSTDTSSVSISRQYAYAKDANSSFPLRQLDVDNPNNADSVQGKVTIENTLNSLVYVFENNNLGSRLALIDRNANNFELHLPEGLITLAFYKGSTTTGEPESTPFHSKTIVVSEEQANAITLLEATQCTCSRDPSHGEH